MKKARIVKPFLEELRKHGNVQLACNVSGISRNSVYEWRRDDPEFRQAWDEAVSEGTDVMNDVAQSKLMAKIQEGYFPAITYQLGRCDPRYMQKIITTRDPTNPSAGSLQELSALAEENIRSYLKQGDKEITKWVAERMMSEKYSKQGIAHKEEFSAKEYERESLERILRTKVPVSPDTWKLYQEEEKRKAAEQAAQDSPPPDPKC